MPVSHENANIRLIRCRNHISSADDFIMNSIFQIKHKYLQKNQISMKFVVKQTFSSPESILPV